MRKCTCQECGRVYDYPKKAYKGHTASRCNSCIVNRRRFKLKQKMIAHKGGKCINCGFDKWPQSLCFHHINPALKTFEFSGSHCRSWTKIEKELENAVLLCQNCHHALHAGHWTLGN